MDPDEFFDQYLEADDVNVKDDDFNTKNDDDILIEIKPSKVKNTLIISITSVVTPVTFFDVLPFDIMDLIALDLPLNKIDQLCSFSPKFNLRYCKDGDSDFWHRAYLTNIGPKLSFINPKWSIKRQYESDMNNLSYLKSNKKYDGLFLFAISVGNNSLAKKVFHEHQTQMDRENWKSAYQTALRDGNREMIELLRPYFPPDYAIHWKDPRTQMYYRQQLDW